MLIKNSIDYPNLKVDNLFLNKTDIDVFANENATTGPNNFFNKLYTFGRGYENNNKLVVGKHEFSEVQLIQSISERESLYSTDGLITNHQMSVGMYMQMPGGTIRSGWTASIEIKWEVDLGALE
jgi:hypothetical protein